jgi:octaprenyl-diphosphate synthase
MAQPQTLSTAAPAASMDQLQALIADDMARVNSVILDKVHSEAQLITELATYIVSAGGKRIRPALTLACAQLCGYSGNRHIRLAACVEFIHTATLLHDDVVDASALRRGQPTANEVWSNQSSVLVGDFLFSRAFQLMVEDGSLKVLKILSDASATISEGEVKQLMVSHSADIDEATYLQVIEGKTAALFAAASEIGGVICDAPQQAEALREFGHHFGIDFQLIDDALDYSASQEDLGKSIGDDFREGKMTLPVILAYQAANEDEKAFFDAALSGEDDSAPDLSRAIEIIARHNGIGQTIARAQSYADKAREALSGFAQSPIKTALLEAVDFCVARAY